MKQSWKLLLFAMTFLLVSSLACNLPIGNAQPNQTEIDPSSLTESTQDSDPGSPAAEEATNPTSTTPSPPAITVIPTPNGPTIEDLMVACPSPEEIDSVDEDLKLEFVSDITAGTLVCSASEGSVDLSLLQKNIYHAILAMRWIEFDQALPWTELSLYDWFVQAVNGIIVDSREEFSHCCTDGGLIVLSLDEDSFATHTDRFLRDELDQDGFIGINGVDTVFFLMVHEARHNERDGYPHLCENGNDLTIDEMGSWGTVYYLNRWLSQHSDPEFMRSSVRLNDWYDNEYTSEADWMTHHRFCEEPSYTPNP